MPCVLPNLLVIGAMKCGTTALHRYLDAHPQITMARAKETDFFSLHWRRGLDWYRSRFDPDSPVRGESSPGYTSPDHPRVPERMARTVPDARLVYLVRDPVDRAVSQYAHHVREGDEDRPIGDALLDPDSQYLSRGRYFSRLRAFLERFRRDQVLVVVQERLHDHRRRELSRIYAHAGVEPDWWDDGLARRWHVGERQHRAAPALRRAVNERVADDVSTLREFLDDDLAEWTTDRR